MTNGSTATQTSPSSPCSRGRENNASTIPVSRFLAESAAAEPSRIAELGWPKPERINQIRALHPKVMEWAFLDGTDRRLLEDFLEVYAAKHMRLNPHERRKAIDNAVAQVAT